MSSTPTVSEDHLSELLLQLKKTSPAQARAILNAQPQIAYALIGIMIKMNAINVEVFQQTLASYGAGQGSQQNGASTMSAIPAAAPAPTTVPSAPPPTAIPPHLSAHQHSRSNTPQYSTPPPTHTQSDSHHGTPLQPGRPAPQTAPVLPDAFAAIPEEQRAVIMQVLAMTPEQVALLPPTERANIMQLRASLGLP
ncbi:uncharacterized protein STEHIDRAFT_164689 [Stereum hirsutum FP-91666 SS1]|uniref:uncharacterized protein n=1 Tax=Stereum hirsutum (strain FP-91666) TaxID=721885 RepID=UPI000440B8CD|nr:uncharacterized protein STEHIDRAFT_164689 [Stereum hirsutum FP-91666 SS1]EIM92403.1 hypothetical protein STEHIDRAFT_164689 [Stereum hirsutum FP-91666 SS1]